MNELANLHTAALPKLKVMMVFLIVMRSTLLFLGGLDLHLLEVESITQVIYYLITLYSSETLMKLLLKTLIEYHQLEIGIVSLSTESHHILITPA